MNCNTRRSPREVMQRSRITRQAMTPSRVVGLRTSVRVVLKFSLSHRLNNNTRNSSTPHGRAIPPRGQKNIRGVEERTIQKSEQGGVENMRKKPGWDTFPQTRAKTMD